MAEPIFISICQGCQKEFDPSELDDDLEYCLNCRFIKFKINTDKTILSIDIGIHHLGLSCSLVDQNYNLQKVFWIDLIDITVFQCLPNCRLYHSNTLCDRITHVLHKYSHIFQNADVILIERQPPQGITAVEQIIFSAYRDKSVLISPTSVHKYFSMRDYDYETRKQISVQIGLKYIGDTFGKTLQTYDRIHDITDTILFVLYWCNIMKIETKRVQLEKKRKESLQKYNKGLGMSLDDFFNMYRYIPSKNNFYHKI